MIRFQISRFYINQPVFTHVQVDTLHIRKAEAAENVILNVSPAQI